MPRVLLVGCGAAKQTLEPGELGIPVRELYTGTLFRSRRRHAEASGCRWFVLSAELGLVGPDNLARPYDKVITQLSELELAAWAIGVTQELLSELEDDDKPRDLVVEIHAGAEYAWLLARVLRALDVRVELPLEGLGIGEQMRWYANRAAEARP